MKEDIIILDDEPDYIVEEAEAYAIALVEKLKENKV